MTRSSNISAQLTFFSRVTRPRGRVRSATLRTLNAAITNAGFFKRKTEQPLLSAAIFRDNTRASVNVLQITAIIGDYDGGKVTIEEASRRLERAGIAALLYETHSSTSDRPRWRVVCPLARPVAPAAHRRLIRVLNHELGGILAAESEDTSRAYFYGWRPGAEPNVVQLNGDTLDGVNELLPGPPEDETPCGSEGKAGQPRDDQAKRAPPQGRPDNNAGNALTYIPEPDTPPERARVEAALRCIDPDCSRAEYLEVLQGLCATGWHDWLVIAERWATGTLHNVAASKFNSRHFASDVRSLRPDGAVTLASLYALAASNGFDTRRRGPLDLSALGGDAAFGRRFAEMYRGKFLFISASRSWRHFDGARWVDCSSSEVLRAARITAEVMLDEANATLKSELSDATKRAHAQAVTTLQNASKRLPGGLFIAASEDGMSAPNMGSFDRDPHLLGVPNGIVDLRTGALLTATPDAMLAKQAGAPYVSGAACPRWHQFLDDVFDGDEDKIEFIKQAVGYSITGLVTEELLFFLVGSGANGKSTFTNVLHAVIGPEYSSTADPSIFATDPRGHRGNGDRDNAQLVSVRFLSTNEIGVSAQWSDERVKSLTSRDGMLSARRLYGEVFTFQPTHTPWVKSNHRPVAFDTSAGFWRRIVVIEFPRHFTGDTLDSGLEAKLLEERSGILAWMVDGARTYLAAGRLILPKSLSAQVAEYREDSDTLGNWIAEECRRASSAETPTSALYEGYCAWLKRAGMRAPTLPVFGRQLAGRGFEVRRSTGGRRLVVGLANTPSEEWAVRTEERQDAL